MLGNEITSIVGANKKRKRIGRGRGSGSGKTCGRGHKGCGSHPGLSTRMLYEGGQMPLFRKLPKRGFNNYKFANHFEIVNVSQLEKVFAEGSVISIAELADAGLVDSIRSKVKILGDGELTKKLEVTAHRFSKSAEEKISGCGGTAKVVA